MRVVLRRGSPTLTTLLFTARTKRIMTLTLNSFLKLPYARTSVITLKSVFSQPVVSPSLDTSSRRVPYDQILIVYDPFANSPFNTTEGPWPGVWDYSPIIHNGSQGCEIESSQLPLTRHSLCPRQLLEHLGVSRR